MTKARKTELTLPVSARDHVRGSARPRVTLLEYGDFDCPFCARVHPVVRALERHFTRYLRFVFRHNPRGELHAHARVAAEASEAAALQGQFWAMHDRLFEHRGPLDEASLTAHAGALGLDLERFARDLHSPEVLARVREDEVSGLRSGVIGTPTFFIDGARFRGGLDFESFVMAVDVRVARATHHRRRPVIVRRDSTGHLDPAYRALLVAETAHARDPSDARAFLAGTRSHDAFAEALGEEFVDIVTTAEDEVEDVFNQEVAEDLGGPFVETTARTEFAYDTEAPNIPSATREPFPKT